MRLRLKTIHWNNLAGGEKMPRLKRWLHISVWWRRSQDVGPDGWYTGRRRLKMFQVIVPLRPFRVGRKSLYLRLSLSRR